MCPCFLFLHSYFVLVSGCDAYMLRLCKRWVFAVSDVWSYSNISGSPVNLALVNRISPYHVGVVLIPRSNVDAPINALLL